MTPTFYRAYRELNRIAGISLSEDVLLYKVLPDPQEQAQTKSLWSNAHLGFHFPPPAPAKKKRFSWAGLFALLALAVVVMWMTYVFLEGM